MQDVKKEDPNIYATPCHVCESKTVWSEINHVYLCTNKGCKFSDPEHVWCWIEGAFPEGLPGAWNKPDAEKEYVECD